MGNYSLEIFNREVKKHKISCDNTEIAIKKVIEIMKIDETISKIEISWTDNKIIYEREKKG